MTCACSGAPSPAAEDRNPMTTRACVGPSRSGGRPPGRSRIATCPARHRRESRRWKRLPFVAGQSLAHGPLLRTGAAAAALWGGRAGPTAAGRTSPRWWSSSGAAEDRNAEAGVRAAGPHIAAVVFLTAEDRNDGLRQRLTDAQVVAVTLGAGRGWQRSRWRPRLGSSRGWWSPFGVADGCNLVVRNGDASSHTVAVVFRGSRGSERQGPRTVARESPAERG